MSFHIYLRLCKFPGLQTITEPCISRTSKLNIMDDVELLRGAVDFDDARPIGQLTESDTELLIRRFFLNGSVGVLFTQKVSALTTLFYNLLV